jgi:hypothetical protein
MGRLRATRNNFSEYHLTLFPIRVQYTHDERRTQVKPNPGVMTDEDDDSQAVCEAPVPDSGR